MENFFYILLIIYAVSVLVIIPIIFLTLHIIDKRIELHRLYVDVLGKGQRLQENKNNIFFLGDKMEDGVAKIKKIYKTYKIFLSKKDRKDCKDALELIEYVLNRKE